MRIRYGSLDRIGEYLKIYDSAMKFMAESGNKNQWTLDHHPTREMIVNHISNDNYYEIYDPNSNEVLAVFALIFGIDPTYLKIDGKWLNDEPYVTIHMVAKKENAKGIFHAISNFAKARCNNVRIDTHEDNRIMKEAILKHGFKYCGIIHLNDKNHSPRLAYHYKEKEIPFDNFKLFIVDYDGTIIDSMGMWSHTWSGFLKEMSVSFNEDIDPIVIPMTDSDAAKYVQANYLPQFSLSEILSKMVEYTKKSYVKQKLKPNALALLKKIKAIGIVVLYSATSMELLKSSINALGIGEYFDEIYSGSGLSWNKGDGTGFLNVAFKEGFKKEEALVIEDSYHAYIGAKKQGLKVLGVEDTNLSHLFLDYEICDYYLPLK